MAIRFLAAGESHGQALVTVVEGIPAGLPLRADDLARDLRRRQEGAGRGARQRIEKDQPTILSGVRLGATLGSPISILIPNRDWRNWRAVMQVEPLSPDQQPPVPVLSPRPGHADLGGLLKYGFQDIRNVLERASARETAARVAAGAVARRLLDEFALRVASHTVAVGCASLVREPGATSVHEIVGQAEGNDLRCVDPDTAARMAQEIGAAKEKGDTVGGVFEVVAEGIPPGLGSYAQWDRRLDGRLAQALMAIQGVKAVEIGSAIANAMRPGSQVHDAIEYDRNARTFRRPTNRAGGLEGGVTTGQPLVVRGYLKPLATLPSPLPSVNIMTKESSSAAVERSDVCAVVPAGVVAEAAVCWVVADAFLEKFGGDALQDIKAAHAAYLERLRVL